MRIKRAFCSYQHSLMVDVYSEHPNRLYRAGPHQFVIRKTANTINEVQAWLHAVNFPNEFKSIREVILMNGIIDNCD